MPVRIYDIAKKLGIESKEVLAKAKELGIAAKVPSSSLDKITAEYLEQHFAPMIPKHAPDAAAVPESVPFSAATPDIASEPPPTSDVAHVEPPPLAHVAPTPVAEPTPVIHTPPAAPSIEMEAPAPTAAVEPKLEALPHCEHPSAIPLPFAPIAISVVVNPDVSDVAPSADASAPAAPAPSVVEPPLPAPVETTPAELAPLPPPAAPLPPPPPPPPPVAKLGEKVGFVVLPPKPVRQQGPGNRGSARGNFQQDPRRPQTDTRGQRPGDNRPQRGAAPQPQGQQAPGQRPGSQTSGQRPGTQAPGQRLGHPPQGQQVPGQRSGAQSPGQRFGQHQQQPRTGGSQPAKPVDRFVAPTTGVLISVKPPIIVRDLAEQLKRKPFQIIADLMEVGVFANVNQSIEEEVAKKICAKYGFRFEVEKRERGGGIVHAPIKKVELDVEDKIEQMKPRAPVVTIMGHVDHGKTTLLDGIRKANVAAGEAGGITQHIGAYTISFPHPERKGEIQQITFLDTPGHAAFSAMRARGANVTDIVVLVVAANDGVMPQTLEALSHAQAAKVPIIVAVNKVDHPNANPMKVRQQLQERGLVPDDWGGDTIFADVSALTKQGVDKLLELILLQADLLELKANPDRRAKGNVIESGLQPGGPTATVLVRKGTLRVGEVVICGQYWGKVRALISEEGNRLKEAGPSVAVKVLGLNGVPEAGLEFSVLEDEKAARALGEQREQKARADSTESRAKVTLETLFATLDATQGKTLKVVVKGDMQGSVEAIVEALKKIDATKVSLEIIHSAVGTITESDVLLASASSAIILGFHTRIDVGVADLAKQEGVQVKLYSIIYELIDQVKEAMAGLLDPILREVVLGSAEVRKLFELSKGGNVAGCMITAGRIIRGKVRILRRKGLIYEGAVQSIRRFQDEVNEVRTGMECGIRIDGFSEFQIGDVIESYSTEKVASKL